MVLLRAMKVMFTVFVAFYKVCINGGGANYISKCLMLEAIICVWAHRLSFCCCITADRLSYTLPLLWLLQLFHNAGGGNPWCLSNPAGQVCSKVLWNIHFIYMYNQRIEFLLKWRGPEQRLKWYLMIVKLFIFENKSICETVDLLCGN